MFLSRLKLNRLVATAKDAFTDDFGKFSRQVREEIAREHRRQRRLLQDSIRDWKIPGGTWSVPPPVWHLNDRRPGFPQPKTVIDVGVGRGTPSLYAAYPVAFHLLVEPVTEFSAEIEKTLAKYCGSWVRAAASNFEGEQTFFVDNTIMHQSGFSQNEYDQVDGNDVEKRKVDVVRLDRLVQAHGLQGPFIIKTDVEGFDLQVLEGAGALLDQTTFVIAECRADSDFTEPTLNNIVKFLYAHGFNIVEFLDVKWEKEDGRLRWVNIAFANDGIVHTPGPAAS